MLISRFHVLAAALTGGAVAASVYFIRHRSRVATTKQIDEELSTWEGDGGTPASDVPPASAN